MEDLGLISFAPLLTRDDNRFINKLLKKSYENRRFKVGLPEKEERNEIIIKWHFAGAGSTRIRQMMNQPVTSKTIDHVVDMFLSRVSSEDRKAYHEKRRYNKVQYEFV